MNALDRLAADMDAHGIRKCVRKPISGYCYVELEDGRSGAGNTFKQALEAAESVSERLAA
jgi:hypothetical protein